MPHGRKKIPFSGKAKKQQLQLKKQKQQIPKNLGKGNNLLLWSEDDSSTSSIQKLNFQPSKKGGHRKNKYVLQFHSETKEELRERKETAKRTLVPVTDEALEVNMEPFFPPELDFPKRPPWDFNFSKQTLESREHRYFTEYIKDIEQKFSWSELSYFELNLETWRQLWRVLEMADIILIIVDIRYPSLLFPPSLYNYVTKILSKDIILVLNKIDLASAPVVVAWKYYLSEKFPNLHIITFTSFPSYNLRGKTENNSGLKIRRRKGRLRMAAEGAQKLFDVCKEIVGENLDLSSWQSKINEEMALEYDDEDIDIGETIDAKDQDSHYEEHSKYKGGILSIGCIGHPNVGKSSLMNALMGRKVVSVSRTPGHTKHFQTIFLTKSVRLCDCPGLVFPSKVPKPIQVLMGSFPIAQLKEPFTTVQFLAERVDLVKILKIQHPENDEEWSAMDICEGFANKKRFFTAKSARLDVYRAANFILRMALEGNISLCLNPPDYSKKKDEWSKHPEVTSVEWVQAKGKGDVLVQEEGESDDGSSLTSDPEEIQSLGEGDESDDEDEVEDDVENVESGGSSKNLYPSNRFKCLDDE